MIRALLSILPPKARRRVRIWQRSWVDLWRGYRLHMITHSGKRGDYPEQRVVTQQVRPGATLEAKLHNMRKAIQRLDKLEIPPNGILSFWQIVGNPGERQGFLPGRNIINGQLVVDYGGGLCQLSSAMYELALRTGMEVLERHAHSTNVYTPETTYTPLGLDATLAYGYKDLRVRNNFSFPVCFSFELVETDLKVALCAPRSLSDLAVRVHHETLSHGLHAEVYRTENKEEILLTKDFYKAWKG